MNRRVFLIAVAVSPVAACTYPLELGLTNRTGRDVVIVNDRHSVLRPGVRTVIRYPQGTGLDGILTLKVGGCEYDYPVGGYRTAFPARIRVTDPPELQIAQDRALLFVADAGRDVPGTGNPGAFPIAPTEVRCD